MALCLSALALYVWLRGRRFGLAFILANSVFAIAFLTHPNALIAFCAFVFLVLTDDRRKLCWKVLAVGALPYTLGLAAWSVYILQAPADFRIQFLANAAGRNSVRLAGLVNPGMAIWNEVIVRYLSFYGFYAVWISGRVSRWLLAIPVIYCLAFFSLAAQPGIFRDRARRTLPAVLLVYFLAMSFLVGFKTHSYLPYIVLLHDAVLAYAACRWWQASNRLRWLAGLVIVIFVSVNWYMVAVKVSENSYSKEYLACANYIRPLAKTGQTVYAISALGFELPYSAFVDDGRLGFFTHRKADIILVDRSYAQWLVIFQQDEPAVYAYIQNLFAHEYRNVFQAGTYKVYQRL
jgi:hypothetical protein